jgi:hypothetical protein
MTLAFATPVQGRFLWQVVMLLIVVLVAWIVIISAVTEAMGQTLCLSLMTTA